MQLKSQPKLEEYFIWIYITLMNRLDKSIATRKPNAAAFLCSNIHTA